MNAKDIKTFYIQQTERLRGQIRALQARGRGFVAGEIAFFVAAAGCVVAFTVYSYGWLLLAALVLLVVYVIIRRMDEDNDRKKDRLASMAKVYDDETAYMEGHYDAFDDGARYKDAHHPFSIDMDIFGPASLFQRINRTVTTGGSQKLASCLSSLRYDARRAPAIAELAAMEPFLSRFKAQRREHLIDTQAIADALQAMAEVNIPRIYTSSYGRVLGALPILGLLSSYVFASMGWISWNVPAWWTVVQYMAVWFLCKRPISAIDNTVGKLMDHLQGYVALIRLVDEASVQSPLNMELQQRVREGRAFFTAMDGLLRQLDRRGNLIGLFLLDTFALSDCSLVRAFGRLQRQSAGGYALWIEAMSDVDALVSMSTYSYNEPLARTAEVVESTEIVYEARGLRHPFLGEKAVSNDFCIADKNYYIITGANMAGKSTFLRTIGVNYILAMNGMPVFADSLRVSVFSLFSSMRTSDDLTHGISYFNAELLRLQELLRFCQQHERTLIILDEILKGTNSLDKLNGSRLFLEAVAQLPVSGIIATHDLKLSELSAKYPDSFHNYCFEIELGTDVTYSYKITPGVSKNQNATFLLKKILNFEPRTLCKVRHSK